MHPNLLGISGGIVSRGNDAEVVSFLFTSSAQGREEIDEGGGEGGNT